MLSFLILTLAAEPFPLNHGDRVVWLGGTLIEREQQSGYWETALIQANAGKSIIFRNLAWSGDTVRGESRAAFDPPEKGYQRLLELTKESKPTVIAICYGSNESFGGEKGIEPFRKDYEKLLKDLSATKSRFILITPIPFENSPGMGDVAAKNKNLAAYCDVIRSVAKGNNAECIDLFNTLSSLKNQLTDNGMHPSHDGYRKIAKQLVGKELPERNDLRKAIISKNELFFHRWRPENETYLFGFRKHEQGKNAKEIVEFDPLIAKAEAEIREMVNKK